MDAGHLRRVGALGAIAALGIFGVATTSASAATTKTITMEQQGSQLFFAGPDKVRRGAELQILNRTDPMNVGPHTFSIVKRGELPTSNRQQRRCFRGNNVCARIAEAHRFNPQTGQVGRNPVFAGRRGWNKAFGNKGDSWYTQERRESFGQPVKTKAGKNLFYLCAVHPEMQGKIKVGKRRPS